MFSLLSILNDILFPCPECGKSSGSGGNAFCESCKAKLEIIPEDAECCPGCGGIISGALACCNQCLAEPERPWQRAYTVMPYKQEAGDFIRRFKFHNTPELARPLGYLLAEKIRQHNISADLLVPVPLHFMRLFSRGYNQSLLLAKITGKECGIPVKDVLKRKYLRHHQAGSSRKARHKNIAGSMYLKDRESVAGKHILLLDDVFTTGATLHAAAMALKKGKPSSIQVITLARTPGYTNFS